MPLSSVFMYGGWFQLIDNMWFLWVLGDNVEDAMSPPDFAVFYLLCGLVASAAQVLTDPDSALPMVCASGAIGGVMGAYARLYPKVRVDTLLNSRFLHQPRLPTGLGSFRLLVRDPASQRNP